MTAAQGSTARSLLEARAELWAGHSGVGADNGQCCGPAEHSADLCSPAIRGGRSQLLPLVCSLASLTRRAHYPLAQASALWGASLRWQQPLPLHALLGISPACVSCSHQTAGPRRSTVRAAWGCCRSRSLRARFTADLHEHGFCSANAVAWGPVMSATGTVERCQMPHGSA